jgi:hypothetical protein
LEIHPRSSLAHLRVAEALSFREDFQAAANQFRESLSGDLEPKWTEVWAHIGLGTIFRVSSHPQERALNEFRLALRTHDNTFGPQDEAVRHLKELGIEIDSALLSVVRPGIPARPVAAAVPRYSEEALIAQLEGTVLRDGVIGGDGHARDLTVIQPLGLGLNEQAIEAVRQSLFVPDQTVNPPHSIFEVDFLLPSKTSHWHLIRTEFRVPIGGTRPTFLSASYPAVSNQIRILGAIGRQAAATLLFDVNEVGVPVNIAVNSVSEDKWGPDAAALVSGFRIQPGQKDGRPISVRCTFSFIWAPQNLTATSIYRMRTASDDRELDEVIEKGRTGDPKFH